VREVIRRVWRQYFVVQIAHDPDFDHVNEPRPLRRERPKRLQSVLAPASIEENQKDCHLLCWCQPSIGKLQY
jgi:hypothetical protein